MVWAIAPHELNNTSLQMVLDMVLSHRWLSWDSGDLEIPAEGSS